MPLVVWATWEISEGSNSKESEAIGAETKTIDLLDED